MRTINVIDLFAGVGGLSYGFKMAGFKIVLAIEHDKIIAESFKLNHSDTLLVTKDIEKVEFSSYSHFNNVDVVMGGPPCQGLSQKGQRLSVKDDRNYLFRHFVKAVKFFRPKFFLMENVPNIMSTANGRFKEEIINEFHKLGYEVTAKVLNAANFGVPQSRKRAFFLGQAGNLEIDLPEFNGMQTSVKDAIYDLPYIESGEGKNYYKYDAPAKNKYQKLMRKGSKGVYNHIATKHSSLALERLSMIPKGAGKEVLPVHHRTKSIYSGTWGRLIEDGLAATLTTRFDTPSSGLFTHPILNRCITTREAARLQSIPDKYIFHGTKGSQMKQVGNAVPPLLAFNIAKAIKKKLRK
jgi:DNA (cytosine-5)-methyltransferase 1